ELLIEIDGFLRRGHAGHAQADIRQFAETEWAYGNQHGAVARAANFEGLIGQRVVDDTDLNSDRLVLHDGGDPLDFPARCHPASVTLSLGQIVGPDKAGSKQAPDLRGANDA